ncbi:serine hydrolase, partial [Streptomyces mirabilis]
RRAAGTVGGSQVKCTSQRPGLAARLSKDIAGALHGRDHAAALALYDRATGTSCDFRADTAFDSASVVKVTILGALLRQSMEQHRALTAHEVELTTAMITKSDNDATNALWHQIGHAGIQHFLTLAGMGDTVPGPKDYWGHTQVTAEDQLRLLRLLTSDNSVLDRDARTYALRLMNRVVPEQRWGTPAGAPATATVQVKNGWLPRDTHGWRVHSVGVFTGGGHDYGLVVLSQDNRTMADGVTTVEGAAHAVNRDLNTSTAA